MPSVLLFNCHDTYININLILDVTKECFIFRKKWTQDLWSLGRKKSLIVRFLFHKKVCRKLTRKLIVPYCFLERIKIFLECFETFQELSQTEKIQFSVCCSVVCFQPYIQRITVSSPLNCGWFKPNLTYLNKVPKIMIMIMIIIIALFLL